MVNFFTSYRCCFYVLSVYLFHSLYFAFLFSFFNTLIHSFTVFVYYFFLSILLTTLTRSVVPSVSKAISTRHYCRLVHSYAKADPVTSVRKLYPRMTEHGHKVHSSTKVGRFWISRSTTRFLRRALLHELCMSEHVRMVLHYKAETRDTR